MSCTTCFRDKPLVSRGLCGACYQRWRKTGTTELQKRKARSTCNVNGCDKLAVSKGLCDTHRKRMERHGHLNETRPDSWGAIHKHPLFNAWAYARRHRAVHPMVEDWANDFLQFATDVGEKPTVKHRLYRADETRPLGPTNFVWKRAVTERVEGEDEATYLSRHAKVFRSLKPEASKARDLKKHYGLSKEAYADMFFAQKGRCAICEGTEGTIIRGRRVALAVDHCHAGGHVRGLLCVKCNRGLGLFGDNPDRLRAAIQYLEHHAPKPTPSDDG